jgi:hypothetical protein
MTTVIEEPGTGKSEPNIMSFHRAGCGKSFYTVFLFFFFRDSIVHYIRFYTDGQRNDWKLAINKLHQGFVDNKIILFFIFYFNYY